MPANNLGKIELLLLEQVVYHVVAQQFKSEDWLQNRRIQRGYYSGYGYQLGEEGQICQEPVGGIQIPTEAEFLHQQ